MLLPDSFGCQYFFGSLSLKIDDHRRRDPSQAPTRCNPVNLALSALAIRTGRDQRRIGPSFDLSEYRIITAIEHFLHEAAHSGKVFRADEQVTLCIQYIFRRHFIGSQQGCARAGTLGRRLRHGFACASS